MTNLSDYFPPKYPALVYTPAMMIYDGAGGVSLGSKANTTNKVTFVCILQCEKHNDGIAEALFNCGISSNAGLLVFSYGSTHSTVGQRDRVGFDIRNSSGTKIVFLSPDIDVLDGEKHTILFAYDANIGEAVLFVDGVDADDATFSERVAPVIGTITTSNMTWRLGVAWWANTSYFTGNLGFVGYAGAYLTDPSVFFDSNNNPIKVDESTWEAWGGNQPFLWNEHGDIRNNKGSFGAFNGLGNRQAVTDEFVISTMFVGGGYDTSDANIVADDVPAGKVAYGSLGRLVGIAPTLIDFTIMGGTGTSIVIDVPTHQDGDMLVAGFCSWVTTITGYTGWDRQIHEYVLSNDWHDLYTRVASSEPPSYTFTGTGGANGHAMIMASFRNVSVIGNNTFVDAGTWETPSVAAYASSLYIGMASAISSSIDLSAGFTGLTTVGVAEEGASAARIVMGYKVLTAHGDSGVFAAAFADPGAYDGYSAQVILRT